MPTQPYIIAGKRVPSVTTIIGKFQDPGALMYWSWNCANEVLLEAHDIVTELQRQGPTAELLRRQQAYLKSKPLDRANFRNTSGRAAEIGTVAHEIISEWIVDKGTIDRINQRSIMTRWKFQPEKAIAVLNAVNACIDWFEQNKFQLEKTEVPLTSPTYMYGGCLDSIGLLAGKRILFDWKSSSGVYTSYLCQIAAYKQLWEENNPHDTITSARLLRFDKSTGDFTEHSFVNLDNELELFLLFRRAYDLLKESDKRV